MQHVWVLLRERGGQERTAHAVYDLRDDLLARLRRIAARNSQYPLRSLGENVWEIGPEEDEGFFGNKPVTFYAVRVERNSGVAQPGATSEPGDTPDLGGSTTPPPRTEIPYQGG